MLRRTISIGSVFTLVLATLQPVHVHAQNASDYPILAPCTRDASVYENVDFTAQPFEEWADIYHKTVSDVIEEHFEPAELECTGDSYEELLEPGEKLSTLAKSLPPWRAPIDANKLKQSDIGLVLVEYLRVYECAMLEYSFFQGPEIIREEVAQQNPISAFLDFFYTDLTIKIFERSDTIVTELRTARPTLYKVLDILSSYDRLRPMEAELECLQRTSLDIRNVMSLTAETSACLPRIWSAKDPLRDLPQ